MGNPHSKAKDGDFRVKYRSWRLGNKDGAKSNSSKDMINEAHSSTKHGLQALPKKVRRFSRRDDIRNRSLTTISNPTISTVDSPKIEEYKRPQSTDNEPPVIVSQPQPIKQTMIKNMNDTQPGKIIIPLASERDKMKANTQVLPIPKAKSTGNLNAVAVFPKYQKEPERNQTSLLDAVIEQLCDAVAVEMVGSHYSTTPSGRILNHLYNPVYENVMSHLKRMPKTYALAATPVEVAIDLKLLAEVTRDPSGVAVGVHAAVQDEDSSVLTEDFNIVVASKDRKGLLDAITRTLSVRSNIMSANILTTNDGFVLDRFTCRQDQNEMAMLGTDLKQEIELYLSEVQSPSPMQPLYAKNPGQQKANNPVNDTTQQRAADVRNIVKIDTVDQKQPISWESSSTSSQDHGNEVNHTASWEIKFEDIKFVKVIGQGRSGKMYLATLDGKKVAAKSLDLSQGKTADREALLSEFYREVTIVSKLHHPNICNFIGVAADEPNFVTVFELLSGGSLSSLLRCNSQYSFFKIAMDIARGMSYLHQNHVIHRDLKSDNIIMDDSGNAKVVDFGLSCFAGTSSELTAETGTYRWMAPEVIRHEPYSFSADVYSFGIVLWELLSRKQPYAGLTPVQAAFAVARQNMRPRLPSYVPNSVANLIKQCWHYNPKSRPHFDLVITSLENILGSLTHEERAMLDSDA